MNKVQETKKSSIPVAYRLKHEVKLK